MYTFGEQENTGRSVEINLSYCTGHSMEVRLTKKIIHCWVLIYKREMKGI